MGFDSAANASSVPSFSRDIVKKKKNNRSAKLKQCKLDARREQWLSQVKNKVNQESHKGGSPPPPLPLSLADEQHESFGNIETRSRGGENGRSSLHESDSETLTSSPGSNSFSSNNILRKERPRTSSSSHSSSSGFCSGSISQDEEEDGSLDDWEAVADALTANDDRHRLDLQSGAETETTIESTAPPEFPKKDFMKPEGKGIIISRSATMNCRAWRPDDAFRPQSLPNLSKQHSFPMNSERHCGRGTVNWARYGMNSQPTTCPICCEDLDLTDSSFLPCSCGFRLCLFCHKRILEADGRCPGCRKQYAPVNGEMGVNGGSPSLSLPHFCSMSSRS